MTVITLRKIGDISSCIQRILQERALHHLSIEEQKDIKLCIYELLSNAFYHGACSKEIFVHYHIADQELTLKVYEPNSCWTGQQLKTSNRCLNEGIYEEHGRGLYLLQQITHEIAFCDDFHGIKLNIRFQGGVHE